MPVNRAAPTPPFHEYVTRYVLVDSMGAIPQSVQAAGLYILTPLHIPTFQRGVTWEVDDVIEFLFSRSLVVGHAILAKPQQGPNYTELVDGLQRFTVGTAILDILYPLVLSPTCSHQNLRHLFTALASYTNNAQVVFANNHLQLFNHPRRAIQDQYQEFHQALSQHITKLLAQGVTSPVTEFAEAVVYTFCGRQIAIDDFTGFTSMAELINTFLGINTIRVDLNTIDLLRTLIVDRAMSVPWSSVDVENVENALTDVFMKGGNQVKAIVPIATAVQKSLAVAGLQIFPSWNSGSSRVEVERFLDFVDACVSASSASSYLGEISEVGALPFSIVVLYYYRQVLNGGQQPSFVAAGFSGLSTVEDDELHYFLRAAYRALLSGTVGQLGPIAEKVIVQGYANLRAVADELNATTGSGALSVAPTAGWIAAQLEGVNKDKAKRVFNACLLPTRGNSGAAFVPLAFGRSTGKWQIDHLIPDSTLSKVQAGFTEGQRIRNFAPIQSQYNKAASNTPCAHKLSPLVVSPDVV